jgi:membrane fusion protein, heavy metal efflux system
MNDVSRGLLAKTHALLTALILAALAACSPPPAPAPVAEPQPIMQDGRLRFPQGNPQLAMLATAPAQAADALAVDLPARLVWNEDRTQRVFAPLSGRVAAIQADLGKAVRKGDVLLSLHSPEFGAAQADAAKANADLRLNERTLQRQQELFEAGIVARKDLEQAQADVARAKAEADRANARVAVYASHSMVNQQLALRSDLGGMVVEKNVNPGQEVRPEQYGPGVLALFVISDPSSLWVQIDAQEADLPLLRPGAGFELSIAALPEQKFRGRVMATADVIDPSTRTIKVRGVVENPGRLLKAEMLGTARISRTMGQGLSVPASAVLLRGTKHWVFVKSAPDTFEPRQVTLSHESNLLSIVNSGLQAGELVVSENALLLAREFRIAEEAAKIAGTAAVKPAESK